MDPIEIKEFLIERVGISNIYFSPPTKMVYPCIVYRRNKIKSIFANNALYKGLKRYQLTLIDERPDSEFVDKILALPMCAHDRFFTNERLNHDVFSIYL